MITFHSGPPPKGFKPDFESFLFNTKTHRILQTKIGWVEFHLMQPRTKRILVSAYFNISNAKARSPFKAPFGSFEMTSQLQPKKFYDFVLFLETEIKKIGVDEIEILCPPELYMPNQPLISTTLISQKYSITQAEPGCCVRVDKNPMMDKMRPNKKNTLRQAIQAGLSYKTLSLGEIKDVYHFLENCRREKNQRLSMTLSELKKTIEAIPQSFFLTGVYLNNQMIAASICIRINQSIVYTFYSGHIQQFNKLSPLVFLLSNLYDWCFQHGVSLLDLGTSALDGKPNFNLLDFKLRLGGTLTPKYRFHKILKP